MSARSDGCDAIVPTQEIAAEVLQLVEKEGISVKTAVESLAGSYDYHIRGSVYAYAVETLKRLNAVDFFLKNSARNFESLDPFIKNLLRIAVYEMKYKGVHPALATDSAVRIAKKKGFKFARIVNAILRNIEEMEIKISDRVQILALTYFHPDWFVEYTMQLLGEEEAIKLMMANNSAPPVYIRVNELKCPIEGVLRYLENNGVSLSSTFMEEVFRVESYEKHPASLDWHFDGKYVIQDLASCFVSHVVNPMPGEVILDLAAAPGIKTSHMAMLMENTGKIIAVDNSSERVERMKSKMKQLGVRNVEIKLGDGCKFSHRVDKVLVDAPCSSTGTYSSQPNVRWTFNRRKFEGTLAVQRKMLKNALKNGDEVVYSTCSITFEENEGNLNRINAKILRLGTPFSRGIKEYRGERFDYWDRVVRSFPHLHNCSGFFVAKLRAD